MMEKGPFQSSSGQILPMVAQPNEKIIAFRRPGSQASRWTA